MCWCKPNVRTPNCGSMQCTAAATKRARDAERARIVEWLREAADAMGGPLDGKVALRIQADYIEHGEHMKSSEEARAWIKRIAELEDEDK